MKSPAHTRIIHKARTDAQRVLMAIDAKYPRCPVHDLRLPKFGGWWFGSGYLQLEVTAPKMISITNIWIDPRHRGRGLGGKMLRAVIKQADSFGVSLELYADAFDQGGMRTDDLWKWYESHGFVRRMTKQGKPYVNGYATRYPR